MNNKYSLNKRKGNYKLECLKSQTQFIDFDIKKKTVSEKINYLLI